ncbi:MAG: S9 family peptidase [Gammaproteobacteria bacterium]|nr:S9 family peptidase [Gammaproteobacteria bacterium]
MIALVVSVTADAAGNLPTRDFFRQYGLRNAVISPDGKLVAEIVNPNGVKDQLLIRVVDSKISGIAYTVDDASDSIGRLQWISNTILVFMVQHDSGSDTLDTAQWLGIHGGKQQIHVSTDWGDDVDLVDPLLNKGNHALVSAHNSDDQSFVYDVDFSNLHDQMNYRHRVASIDGYAFLWLTNQNGEVTLAGTYGKGGEQLYSVLRPDTGHWYQFKAVDPGKTFFPVSYAPDGHDLIVDTNIGHETTELWTYDPYKDKFLKKIYGNNDYDIDDILYDWNRYLVTGVTWYQGPVQRYEIFDQSLQDVQKQLIQRFPGSRVNVISGDRALDRSIAYVTSADNPGNFYVYEAKTNKLIDVGYAMPWIPTGTFVNVQSNSVISSDGFKIDYLVALPSDAKSPYPVVVMPHGGPLGVEDTLSFDPEVQFLANRGFAVIQVNYRGSGGEGEKFFNAGKKQWGKKIEDDIVTAVHAALTKYPLDANRICIYGGSYGGYSAIMSVIRFPTLYKCAASYAGVMDVPLLYETSDWSDNRNLRKLMFEIVGNPKTHYNQLFDISPVYNAEKITRPVLIAQGAIDERVDQEQAYRMKAVLQRLGKPYEFYIYQNEGHGLQYLNNDIDFHDKLVTFLDKYLEKQK